MFKWGCLLAAMLFASPAAAQTLQKCIGKGGATAYRSGPCEAGERLQGVRDGSSDRRTPEEWRALRQRQAQQTAAAKAMSRMAGTDRTYIYTPGVGGPTQSESRDRRCESSKQTRDAEIKRLGRYATMEVRSRWNQYVYDRCK
jgi:hypothetical protein